MKLACSSLCFSKKSFDVACEQAAALGFRFMDVGVAEGWAHFNPSELVTSLDANVKRLTETCAQFGLTPVAFNVGLGHRNFDEKKQRLTAVCDFAKAVGVKVICLGAPRNDADVDEEIELHKQLVPIAAERGVQLTIETHMHCLTEIPEVALRFCREVDGLGLTFDPTHFTSGPAQGNIPDEIFRHVHHVHLRDAGLNGWQEIQVPVGDGKVNFETVIRKLKQAGYNGALSCEYIDSVGKWDTPGCIEELKRLKSIIEGIVANLWGG